MLASNPLPTSYPALTLLTFWVTFCVTFHLTNTSGTMNNTEMQSMEIPYQKVGDCYVNDLQGRQSVIP